MATSPIDRKHHSKSLRPKTGAGSGQVYMRWGQGALPEGQHPKGSGSLSSIPA